MKPSTDYLSELNEKLKRNKDIVKMRNRGVSVNELKAIYGISRQRIHVILKRYGQ